MFKPTRIESPMFFLRRSIWSTLIGKLHSQCNWTDHAV